MPVSSRAPGCSCLCRSDEPSAYSRRCIIRRHGDPRHLFTQIGGNSKGGASPKLTREGAVHDAGLSDDQRKNALRIATVPLEEFEAAVEGDKPPTVEVLIFRNARHRHQRTLQMPIGPVKLAALAERSTLRLGPLGLCKPGEAMTCHRRAPQGAIRNVCRCGFRIAQAATCRCALSPSCRTNGSVTSTPGYLNAGAANASATWRPGSIDQGRAVFARAGAE